MWASRFKSLYQLEKRSLKISQRVELTLRKFMEL